ncbi:MAG: hypothetical protein GWN96_08955 [candidate division Zixibacteria bacterium]|nr:hypothetical protein [Phycisphaerae bacterium]NIS16341.1 hypothetical protein [candidate division Zixibacteria bacterium]
MGTMRDLFRTRRNRAVKKEKVTIAVEKSFFKNENGLWQVGNHIMTADRPPCSLIADRIMFFALSSGLDTAEIRLALRFMLTWDWAGAGKFDIIFNGICKSFVNIGVKDTSVPETVNNFTEQFAGEFLKHYNEL